MTAQRWRMAIVLACAAVALILIASAAGGGFGYLGLSRVGLWGMQTIPEKPFVLAITSLDPGRAAEKAGILPGDRIDVRMQTQIVRLWLLDEPVAGKSVPLTILRDGRQVSVTVMPLPISVIYRRQDIVVVWVAVLWMLAFAALLAWRRPESYEVRLLALALVCLALALSVPNYVGSSPALYEAVFLAVATFKGLAVILWVSYCGCFARPLNRQRRIVQFLGIAAAGASIAVGIAAVIGESTLWFSAEGYLELYAGRSEIWYLAYDVAVVLAIVASVLAVGASRGEERQRAVWAMVPLVLLFASMSITTYMVGSQTSYGALMFWIAARNVSIFIAPIGLTYAALGRRLLDVGFVVNRALIFGIVSAIVVCVFLIVEWGANEMLVNASRTAGTIFSMAVALALGLSMRPIHRWTDRFVDEVFFRKRHEDEAALRRFAHEAAYITDRATLVDRAVEVVREHANASTASIVVPGVDVDENDRAIVALRTWHKPVDLDTLDTTLKGEYAYPMLSRGKLVGTLVCGPKPDGESYAPDESAALFELAHGVGTALDLLDDRRGGDSQQVLEELAALNGRMDELLRNR